MSVRPDVGLERLIHGLEQELLAAPDEEFLAGARDLGMNPDMKGSAAFLGVKNLSPQLLSALSAAYRARMAREDAADVADGHDEERDPAEPDPFGSSTRRSKRNADA
jgi:hypothetical protein